MVESNPKPNIAKFRFLALPTLVGLIILILTLTLLLPKINQILRTRQSLAQEKVRLSKLTQKVADLEGLDESELSLKANLLIRSLPAEKDVPQIFATLAGLSSQTGMTLESIKVSPGELSTVSAQLKTKGPPLLTFKVSGRGTMEAMKSFFGQAASTIPVMKISDVSLTSAGGETTTDISLDTYFLALPKTLGPIETPLAKITSNEELLYQEIRGFTTPLTEEILPSVTTGKEDPFSF